MNTINALHFHKRNNCYICHTIFGTIKATELWVASTEQHRHKNTLTHNKCAKSSVSACLAVSALAPVRLDPSDRPRWSASQEPCVHISLPIRLGKCNICQQRNTNMCVFICDALSRRGASQPYNLGGCFQSVTGPN